MGTPRCCPSSVFVPVVPPSRGKMVQLQPARVQVTQHHPAPHLPVRRVMVQELLVVEGAALQSLWVQVRHARHVTGMYARDSCIHRITHALHERSQHCVATCVLTVILQCRMRTPLPDSVVQLHTHCAMERCIKVRQVSPAASISSRGSAASAVRNSASGTSSTNCRTSTSLPSTRKPKLYCEAAWSPTGTCSGQDAPS